MSDEYAGVFILEIPVSADREYTYFIPRELIGSVRPGVFVIVPFGGGNRRKKGVVFSVSGKADVKECKPIISVINDSVSLTDEMLGLCEYISDRTVSTFGDAVRAMIPQGVLSRVTDTFEVTESDPSSSPTLSPKALYLYSFIKSRGVATREALRSEFEESAELSELLAALIKRGLIKRGAEIKNPTGTPKTVTAELAVSTDEALAAADGTGGKKMRSVRSREILRYLSLHEGKASSDELKDALGPVGAQLRQLSEAGYIKLTEKSSWRNPFAGYDMSSATKLSLSEKQNECFSSLRALYRSGEAKAALLFGVTGSGKTSVIRAMIDEVTGDGRSVIVLVPEIALTPQTVKIFCSNYGERVAVLHSSLSVGERADAWRRINSGGADIVIGTRSAVFAPVKNLGMIVIDEEQEHTYKSEESPKYSAHDVARYRCAANKALMLLSSATPSLTSYYKAVNGNYSLIKLGERYGGAKLPEVIISDMRTDRRPDSTSPIGMLLEDEIQKTLSAGKQAILFLNRRGYNNFLSCRRCGAVVSCPKCSVALTYHTKRRVNSTETRDEYRDEHISAGHLMCHYCGYKASSPSVCPECGSPDLYYMGWGTQRVEQELSELFPTAKILRMDADTTRTKSSYSDILGTFGRHEADILIGTQMVTKGHDFPDVTLVGVLLAESSLYLDDYRAGERTFSLITQVVGRSGRTAGAAGRAVIQTYTPESETLTFAAAQDYEGFYENEIALRRAYQFPPFCDIAVLTAVSEDEGELSAAILRVSDRIKLLSETKYKDVAFVMFGPFEAPIYKLNGKFRMRIVCKCRLSRRTREMFTEIIKTCSAKVGRRVGISIDFNPNSV